ncbi:MAG: TonB-dependent receptor [Ignavibacteriota bacterium]
MRDNTILRIISLFLFTFLLILPISVFAQSTGSIGGRVTDVKNGSPLGGAVIKIEGSNMGAIADDNGEYVILNVDVGSYTLLGSFMGYETKKVTGVRVSVDGRSKANFELGTGSEITTDVVVIEAERKGIDVEQSGRIIETENIKNSGTRGITNIVSKTAGVVQDERGGSINIRGGRSNESVIIVDGVETTNPLDGSSRAFVPNNLLQEITVLTGGFGAEYGNVLSGVINVSTKSGTSKYSGSVEAITDEFAGRWIDTKSQGYNLYNVNLGGPLIPTKELAQVLNVFLSYEKTFQRITIGSWVLDRLPTIVPNGTLKDNEQGTQSFNGRFNVNLSELKGGKIPVNLRFGATYNLTNGRVLYGSNIYNSIDGNPLSSTYGQVLSNSNRNPVTTGIDQQYFGRISVTPSPKFFFELQGSYFKSYSEQADPIFGDQITHYGDTIYNPLLTKYGLRNGQTIGTDPNTSYLYQRLGNVIDVYQKLDVSYFSSKIDATWALLSKNYGDHEVKFGGEYKYNTLRRLTINPAATADQTVQNVLDRYYGTNMARLKTYGYTIYDQFNGVTTLVADENNKEVGTAAKHPITGGFYVRDKVSFADFNFNGGVRVDFFDVNDKVFKSLATDIVGPDGLVATADDFTDSKMDFFVSPRLGFSFPITDKIIFVAQYGKMVQLPQLNLLYVNQATMQRFLSTALQDVIENSSLKPTKLTQYEIGFKQQVGDYINLGVTAFYKEAVDQIGAGRIKATTDGKVPVGFVTYLNNDFSISRGFDFYLSMRRWNRMSVDLAYTLSYATGTGSDPFSKTSLANDATQELPQFVYPLDYDQRHTGSVNFDYRFGGDEDVPKGFMGKVLRNAGMNFLFSFNSGRPYTARTVSNTATGTAGDYVLSAKNELYRDWNFRLDFRVDKTVPVWKTNWNFYVYVINLLNTEIINNTFDGTGKPNDNGFLNTPTGASRYENDPVFRKLWPERVNFLSNYGPPRQVRFGVNISF